MNIIGLDVSANRIAWAWLYRERLQGSACEECARGLSKDIIVDIAKSLHADDAVYCLEINTRPKLMHKGRVSPQMVKSYMRSRWVEGRLLQELGLPEPVVITNKMRAFGIGMGSSIYAIQASAEKKTVRRNRMELLYQPKRQLSQDEIDALAVAHQLSVAMKMARAK